jgi:hypothetical protein
VVVGGEVGDEKGVGVGKGVWVTVEVGEGGVYMAVWVPKKDATIVPTPWVRIALISWAGSGEAPQAAARNATRIVIVNRLFDSGIRTSAINLTQKTKVRPAVSNVITDTKLPDKSRRSKEALVRSFQMPEEPITCNPFNQADRHYLRSSS